jgi:hypothetical protein
MGRLAQLELLGLIGAGAVGARVHAAIEPDHVREWTPLGASFVAVSIALATAVVGVSLRPRSGRLAFALALLLGAVAAAYLVTRLAAIPPLDPEREAFDALGVGTTSIEVVGLLLAAHLYRPRLRLPLATHRGGRK